MYRGFPPGRTRRMLYAREFQEPIPDIIITDVDNDMYNEHTRLIEEDDGYEYYYDTYRVIDTSTTRASYGLPSLEIEENEDIPDLIDFTNSVDQEIIRPSLSRLVTEGLREHTTIDMYELGIDDILNRMEYGMSDTYEALSLLEDVKIGLISEKILKNTVIRNSDSIGFCIICQEDIFLCIERELGCKHRFHILCVDTWLTSNNKCPTCRTEI